ncbi:hypothetical protein [Streptomyces sudanensis]|uniref:Uncharacterized protein n=1 Tax=Streptomyces sudanensis TaxID=436397 RepID=A0ABY4TGV6_9ACTN|nr:hypothetical protein [Streptomyces sudanensis]URN17354.1 hypothetical protein MW084_17080 [Streptomyces sudanensis]
MSPHDRSADQIVFRWDTDNLSGTTGFGPVAWSCPPARADAVFRASAPLLRATGEATAPALLRLEDGDWVLLVRRVPWRDAGGRAGTLCHALTGPAAVLDPATCLGLHPWSWEGGDLPLAEVRGTLPPVPASALLPAADAGKRLLDGGLARVRRELVGATAELLRHPDAEFTFLDPSGRAAHPVLWGLHGLFGGQAARWWTFATHDTVESDRLRFVFVSRWTGEASGSGARRRADPTERCGDRAEAVAERLVHHHLRERYAVRAALRRAADHHRATRGGPATWLALAEAALSDLDRSPSRGPEWSPDPGGDPGRDSDRSPGFQRSPGFDRAPGQGPDPAPGRGPSHARDGDFDRSPDRGPDRPPGPDRASDRSSGFDRSPGQPPRWLPDRPPEPDRGRGRPSDPDRGLDRSSGPDRLPGLSSAQPPDQLSDQLSDRLSDWGLDLSPEPPPDRSPGPDRNRLADRDRLADRSPNRPSEQPPGRLPGRNPDRSPDRSPDRPSPRPPERLPSRPAAPPSRRAPEAGPRQDPPVPVVAPEWPVPAEGRPRTRRWLGGGSPQGRGPADDELLCALRASTGGYEKLTALMTEVAERWPSWNREQRVALCAVLLERELFVTDRAGPIRAADDVRAANAASLYRWAVRPLLDDPALSTRVTDLLPRLSTGPHRAARAAVRQITLSPSPGLPEPTWQALLRAATPASPLGPEGPSASVGERHGAAPPPPQAARSTPQGDRGHRDAGGTHRDGGAEYRDAGGAVPRAGATDAGPGAGGAGRPEEGGARREATGSGDPVPGWRPEASSGDAGEAPRRYRSATTPPPPYARPTP